MSIEEREKERRAKVSVNNGQYYAWTKMLTVPAGRNCKDSLSINLVTVRLTAVADANCPLQMGQSRLTVWNCNGNCLKYQTVFPPDTIVPSVNGSLVNIFQP